MSDLQIGLAMLGVIVVAAVLIFNWWQARQFRRRGAETFSGGHDDVLFGKALTPQDSGLSFAPSQDRAGELGIEPDMEPRMEPRLGGSTGAVASTLPRALGGVILDIPRPEIDYIAEIGAGAFVAVDKLARMQHSLPDLMRRVSFGGLNQQTRSWEPLNAINARYSSVRLGLQLVDRSGPVNDRQLRQFADAIRAVADDMGAVAAIPDFGPALDHAVKLDQFCADVDVLVGINVIAEAGQVFHGTKIRALAEAAGLQLQASGVFQCQDEQGGALFSLDNQESEPFLIDRIRNINTPGITFLLDVPRVANGIRVFDRMVAMSRNFADSLDGSLADDNRALLNDSGLDRIRAQLRAIYNGMEQRGIEAGSPLALRLFS